MHIAQRICLRDEVKPEEVEGQVLQMNCISPQTTAIPALVWLLKHINQDIDEVSAALKLIRTKVKAEHSNYDEDEPINHGATTDLCAYRSVASSARASGVEEHL
jgi:hypothetical protein